MQESVTRGARQQSLNKSAVGISDRNPVVAHIKKSHHPYSSIALSPDRQHAITASKDTLQIIRISSRGMEVEKTIRVAHYFQKAAAASSAAAAAAASNVASRAHQHGDFRDVFIRDTFSLLGGQHTTRNTNTQSTSTSSQIDVFITDVAWSIPSQDSSSATTSASATRDSTDDTSLIAAAGSNGVIVIFTASSLLEGGSTGTQKQQQHHPHKHPMTAPEAVLSQHARAVNRLAWHPKHPGLLLSASQDGTCLLWESKKTTPEEGSSNKKKTPADTTARETASGGLQQFLFGGKSSVPSSSQSKYSWHCRATFTPKSEAVRDIRWSPFHDDVFALVTTSGSLIVYNMNVPPRAMAKFSAHSGEAASLDWHPTQRYIIATGGANDRSVKVWDLEKHLSLDKDDNYAAANLNTMTSRCESVGTEGSNETERSNPSLSFAPGTLPHVSSRTHGGTTRHKTTPKSLLHNLTISASVMRLKWRPPANDTFFLDDEDRHVAMMAVATAPIKGASAGGSGVLALWSYHRPFMPLSIVEGHKEGAVTDFDWLDTPVPKEGSPKLGQRSPVRQAKPFDSRRTGREPMGDSSESLQHRTNARLAGGSHEVDAILFDNSEVDDVDKPVGIWQHVISVGRDGRCLIQSFVRGERPISSVPPSCFALANLSPFQKGYGSLQLFSVFQSVPSDPTSDFFLTGLRMDSVTKAAPGIFRELAVDEEDLDGLDSSKLNYSPVVKRFPASSPVLQFNVIDQGDLDDESKPAGEDMAITVCSEVVHLSRFAAQYVLYRDDEYTSRVALCLHNGEVAEGLQCRSIAHMWRMVAAMLESSGMDELPDHNYEPNNVMQFVILPTIRSLLEERANNGDVQTCVALCEVLQVIKPDQTVRIPGLNIILVREWYLSYIDLLRDMCLFSHASHLIRSCKDPFIAALNQQSTTIHESCPHCGKPLSAAGGAESDQGGAVRRICKSCRRRVGLCFLCHEPVKGMYVWCPGCGHGGHLDHALQWFGGLGGVREVCPTGCGHRCFSQLTASAFPRTESLKEITSDQLFEFPTGAL